VLFGWVELGVVTDADPEHPSVLDHHLVRPICLDDANDPQHSAGLLTVHVVPTVSVDRPVEGNRDHRRVIVSVLD